MCLEVNYSIRIVGVSQIFESQLSKEMTVPVELLTSTRSKYNSLLKKVQL